MWQYPLNTNNRGDLMNRICDAHALFDHLLGESTGVDDLFDNVVYRWNGHPNVMYRLSPSVYDTTLLTLELLYCTRRCEGHASRFLHELCEKADEWVVKIDLQAACFAPADVYEGDFGEALDQEDLVNFYESFGFEEHNEGLGEQGYWMIRVPNV